MAVLTVTELKKYLRYEAADTSNDDPLGLIVDGGQRYIENYTGHLLVQRMVTETPPAFPTARRTNEVPYYDLRWKPYVADSLLIDYLDANFEYTDPSDPWDEFTIYDVHGTARVIPNSAWPSATLGISFSYVAGYANLAAVPDDLLHALAVYAGMSDEERGAPGSAGWTAIHHLLDFYRMPVVA